MTATKEVRQSAGGIDLAERCVAVRIRTGKIGNTRKVDSGKVEVDADKDLLSISKRLFDSDEFRAIKNLDSEVRRYLESKALPFETGIHLIPNDMIEEVDTKLREFAERREALVEIFIDVYPVLVEAMPDKLRSLHNSFDYGTVKEARRAFHFDWQYRTFGTPGKLKELSAKLWREERAKAARTMADACEEIKQVLRASMLELITTMRDRLETPEGKPRIFGPATSNLRDFLADFNLRNVVDDSDLSKLVDKAKGLLDGGITANDLKDNAALCEKVKTGMAGIASKLEGMVIAKPTRKIRLED